MQKIPQETLKNIHNELSGMLNSNFRLIFLKRICDILVIIHNHLNSYQDLMMIINNLSSTADSKIKQIILYILELLCDYCFDEVLLKSQTEFLTTIFSQYTQDPDYIVRVSAIKATISFLACIEDEKFAKQFKSILPILLQNTVDSIKQDQQAGKECIESMGDLIEGQPKLVKEFTNDFLEILTQVMEMKDFEEGLRKAALTAVVAFSTKNALSVRKSVNFTAKTLPAIIRMLTEIDTKNINDWENDLNEEIASKNDISGATQDALANINSSLGVKYLLPLCVKYIQELISSNEWQHKQAGLMAISVIIEGASKHFSAELDGLMILISNMMNETNPILVWSILTCLAILCSEYTPIIQQKYHSQIMNFILTHMKNSSLKIRYRAVSSVINFSQNLSDTDEDAGILKQYANPLLSSIKEIMDSAVANNQFELLEEVLKTLSTVAVILEDSFADYYTSFMPNLKKTLLTCPADTPKQVNIRVNTIECVGYLAYSMKNQPNVFGQDFNEIMSFLVKLESSGISDDDKHRQAIISVYSQFACCLKESFAPYLEATMPTILKSLNIDVSLTMRDESENSNMPNNGPEFMVDLKLMGGKKFFTINTDALELKLSASTSLYSICKNLKKSIFPYLQSISELLIPLISLKYSKEIRQNSMKNFNALINACTEEKDMLTLINLFFPPMLQELANTNKISKNEESHFLLKRFFKALKPLSSPNTLDSSLTQSLIAELKNSLILSNKMKANVMEEYKEEMAEADEEMKEQIMEEYEEFNDLFEAGMDISGKLFKLTPNFEQMVMSEIAPFYAELLNRQDCSDREVILGACFFDELITSASLETLSSTYSDVMQKFISFTKTKINPDVQQSTVYGLGMICQRIPSSALSSCILSILETVLPIAQHPEGMTEERISCTDNAIGALFRICLHHNITNENEMIFNCVSYFPLKTDEEEARNIHKLFFTAIQQGNPKINSVPKETLSTSLQRIKQLACTPEGKEILDDEGRNMLASFGV